MIDALLASIAEQLSAARIPYMVIGGQAVLVHGVPRLTQDIDITLGVAFDGLERVLAVITTLGLEPLVEPRSFAADTMVIPCRVPGSDLRVDFILSSSPYEREALQRVRSITVAGKAVRFASAEDLVIHKVIAGRARDVEDVRGILIKNPALDRALIRRCLREWSSAVEQPLIERFDEIDRDAR